MRWEERLLDLFDDLEQQAEGIALAERDARRSPSRAARSTPRWTLADRLHASVGTPAGPRRRRARRPGRAAGAGRGRLVPARRRGRGVGGRLTGAVRAVRGLLDAGRAPEVRDRSPPGWAWVRRCAAWREDRAEVVLHRRRRVGGPGRAGTGRPGLRGGSGGRGEGAGGTSRWCRSGRSRRCAPGEPSAAASSGGRCAVPALGVRLGVHAGDVLLQLDGLDAVLLATADLDVAQLAGLHERPHLGDRGRQDLRDVGQGQEPTPGLAACVLDMRPLCQRLPTFRGRRRAFGCGRRLPGQEACGRGGAEPGGSEHDVPMPARGASIEVRPRGVTAPASPTAVRARHSRWRDPRLVVGVAVVAACTLLGARLRRQRRRHGRRLVGRFGAERRAAGRRRGPGASGGAVRRPGRGRRATCPPTPRCRPVRGSRVRWAPGSWCRVARWAGQARCR